MGNNFSNEENANTTCSQSSYNSITPPSSPVHEPSSYQTPLKSSITPPSSPVHVSSSNKTPLKSSMTPPSSPVHEPSSYKTPLKTSITPTSSPPNTPPRTNKLRRCSTYENCTTIEEVNTDPYYASFASNFKKLSNKVQGERAYCLIRRAHFIPEAISGRLTPKGFPAYIETRKAQPLCEGQKSPTALQNNNNCDTEQQQTPKETSKVNLGPSETLRPQQPVQLTMKPTSSTEQKISSEDESATKNATEPKSTISAPSETSPLEQPVQLSCHDTSGTPSEATTESNESVELPEKKIPVIPSVAATESHTFTLASSKASPLDETVELPGNKTSCTENKIPVILGVDATEPNEATSAASETSALEETVEQLISEMSSAAVLEQNSKEFINDTLFATESLPFDDSAELPCHKTTGTEQKIPIVPSAAETQANRAESNSAIAKTTELNQCAHIQVRIACSCGRCRGQKAGIDPIEHIILDFHICMRSLGETNDDSLKSSDGCGSE